MISKSITIVMVDDDADDLFLTKLSFRNADFDVNFIGLQSASALYNYIQTNGILSIDVLLLDLNMPLIGGLEILETLGLYPGFDKIITFIFSTSKRESDKQTCLAKGADGYIAKPSNAVQTKAFVERIYQATQTLNMPTPVAVNKAR